MLDLREKWYELVSGPYRTLKVFLLLTLGLWSLAALLLIVSPSNLIAALGLRPLTILGVYICGLLTLQILILSRLSAKLNDVRALVSVEHEVMRRHYRLADFFLDGAAADASLCLQLLKCLAICRPKRILELGSGQTTKLLANYYRANPEAYVLTLENSQEWVSVLKPYVTFEGRCHDYRHAPLEWHEFTLAPTGRRIRTRWYRPVSELSEGRFDLILVDGPGGDRYLSRVGLLEYFPGILASSFVVIFDDAGRYGEASTIELFSQSLLAAGTEFITWELNGLKRQVLFASRDLEFVQYS